MNRVLFAEWAELGKFQTIWIVTTILLRHVIAVLAILAGHSHFWPNVTLCHFYLLYRSRGEVCLDPKFSL
jgi:hypothetical protein